MLYQRSLQYVVNTFVEACLICVISSGSQFFEISNCFPDGLVDFFISQSIKYSITTQEYVIEVWGDAEAGNLRFGCDNVRRPSKLFGFAFNISK